MKFNIFVVDPPYSFSDKLQMSSVKRGAEANYNVMTNEKLFQLPIKDIVADDAILALWVPSSLLQLGLDLMKIYGFEQKQTWIWVKTKNNPLKDLAKYIKNNSGTINSIISKFTENYWFDTILSFKMGRIARNVHEIVLIGTRGNISKHIKNRSQRTVFFDKVLKHSKKPEILQNNLDIIFPDPELKRIEIFGRRSRENWVVLGNESPTTFGEDIFTSIEKLK
jgi:N6-adenosine-specific RNA methylase IME4